MDDTNKVETLPENYPGGMGALEIISDLKECLNPEKFSICGSELQQLLVYYTEQFVEPGGWQALWRKEGKKSTEVFKTGNLTSPALVEVLSVEYGLLEATVSVINGDQQSMEDEQHTVPLIELHPLHNQENGAVNVEATNTALQRLRFLHQFLLFPWDSDSQENWFEVQLPIRVKMFCELRSGLLNEEIAARYLFLRSEAHQVDKQLQLMAEKISESDEEEMEDAVVGSIADLNSKLEQIQQDVEIILNPSTRMLLFGSKVTRVKDKNHPEVLLVVQGQSCQNLHQVLNEIEAEFSPQSTVRCYPSLQTALDDCRTDDVIAIPKGIHSLLNLNSMRHGGTLLGIGPKEDVVIHLGYNSEVGLAFDVGSILLKNCTILVNRKQSGISVKGKITLDNVILRGASPVEGSEASDDNKATSWKGLYVAADAQAFMKQCSITNFDVGLRVRAGGQVLLTSSEVVSCNIGILAEENAQIEINDCDLKMCKEFAIGVEMNQDSAGENLFGGVELLQTIPKTFNAQDCRCYGNAYNVKLEY